MGEMSDYFEQFPEEDPAFQDEYGRFDPEMPFKRAQAEKKRQEVEVAQRKLEAELARVTAEAHAMARRSAALKKLSLLILALMGGLPLAAWARLGESEALCERRYGKALKDDYATFSPLLKGAEHRIYRFEGWRIRVAFLNGLAVREDFSKAQGAAGGSSMKDYEIQAILEAEQNGASWKPAANGSGRRWVRSDGAVATMQLGSSLRLEVPEAAEAEQRAAALKAEKARAAVPKF